MFSLNSANLVAKIVVILKKDCFDRTCYLLGEKPGCYHSATKTQATEEIFKLISIHARSSAVSIIAIKFEANWTIIIIQQSFMC